MKKGFVHNALVLLAITLVSGFLLAAVYAITKEPIKQAEENAKQEAYQKVLQAETYEKPSNYGKLLKKANDAFREGKHDGNGLSLKGVMVEEALEAKDKGGALLGYILTVTSKNGYGGNVQITFGMGTDFAITGFEVLSHSETPGFGARCEDEKYKATFKGDKTVADVDIISGATYTTTAIKQSVSAGITFVTEYIDKEGI